MVDKKKVLVTGATRGIGRSIASLLLRKGFEVVGTGRRDSAERTHDFEDLEGITWHDVDCSERSELSQFMGQISETGPFYGLVNNAGVNRIKPTGSVTSEDYDFVHDTNLRAPYFLCRELIEGMSSLGEGRIVNIASIWSIVTKAHRSLYSSAKTGLVGMTRAMAAEHGDKGILVNLVSPGFVLTDMTRESLTPSEISELSTQVPIRRMANPDDIAQVVAFLISSENRYINGQNIVVDGGFSIV